MCPVQIKIGKQRNNVSQYPIKCANKLLAARNRCLLFANFAAALTVNRWKTSINYQLARLARRPQTSQEQISSYRQMQTIILIFNGFSARTHTRLILSCCCFPHICLGHFEVSPSLLEFRRCHARTNCNCLPPLPEKKMSK